MNYSFFKLNNIFLVNKYSYFITRFKKNNNIFHKKNKNIKIYLNIIFYNYFFIYLNKLS